MMTPKYGTRLIAIIEITHHFEIPQFKVRNFTSDVQLKPIMNGKHHSKDNNGKYLFQISKTNNFQISYGKNLKNLAVIVGENGSGKTRLINRIVKKYHSTDNDTILVLQNMNKDSFFITSNRSFPIYNVLDLDNKTIETDDTLPNIIKFSNSKEYRPLNNIHYEAIDASELNEKNIINHNGRFFEATQLSKFSKNRKLPFKETLSQIEFLKLFANKIKPFADFTNKPIVVNWNYRNLPLFPINDNTEIMIDGSVIKSRDQFVVIEYFSILIDSLISPLSRKKPSINKQLLDLHIQLWKNTENKNLQYQSICSKENYFLPDKYSLFGRPLIAPQIKDLNQEATLKCTAFWHELYIINMFFELFKFDKLDFSEYKDVITEIFTSIIVNDNFIENEVKSNIEKFSNHFNDFVLDSDNSNVFLSWNQIWRSESERSIKVALSMLYSSYFEISSNDNKLYYNLISERVWKKYSRKDDLEALKELSEKLFLYDESTFDSISSIVDSVAKVNSKSIKQSFLPQWKGISSGELSLLKSFCHLYEAKNRFEINQSSSDSSESYNKKSFLVLLDEIDLGLHPEWQRKWVSNALPIIEEIFRDDFLQVILTTHSPIILSDIYSDNIIILLNENESPINWKPKKTFAQNIYTLYNNTFFLRRLMGEYAYKKIEDTIAFLNHKINSSNLLPDDNGYNGMDTEEQIATIDKLIDSIGEPIIANQLHELYEMAFPQSKTRIIQEKQRIEQEIIKLKTKLEKLNEDTKL
ncbi:MAG: AAA family ATPase [Streptococcus salivarius]|nr:AAA family ATPase [Streptococcus salivarius]MDU2933832.1 AAA family ATPase [Streptococcus salivarius]